MSDPRVTVIITSYNQEEFIGEALQSVAHQDYEDLEILVCDDASTDRTLEVLASWSERDPRVHVVPAAHNTGLSENRNRGLRAHTGELVALLDGDDRMRPGKVRAQVELLRAHPSAAGCVHDAEVFRSEDGENLGLFSRYAGARGLREGGVELWLDPTYFVLPSTLMFRSRFVPGHLFEPRLPYTADWLFSIEVFRHGRCLLLEGVYVDYRRHGAQVTRGEDSDRRAFEEGMMAMALVDSRYPELFTSARTVRAALLYGEARRRLRSGDRAGSLRYARSAARSGGLGGHARLLRQVLEARWGRPVRGARAKAPRA